MRAGTSPGARRATADVRAPLSSVSTSGPGNVCGSRRATPCTISRFSPTASSSLSATSSGSSVARPAGGTRSDTRARPDDCAVPRAPGPAARRFRREPSRLRGQSARDLRRRTPGSARRLRAERDDTDAASARPGARGDRLRRPSPGHGDTSWLRHARSRRAAAMTKRRPGGRSESSPRGRAGSHLRARPRRGRRSAATGRARREDAFASSPGRPSRS